MATISELDTKRISALTRKTVSGALDYLDYLVFNDASAGEAATQAITVGALDSYFKVNIGHLGRTALSGDSSVDYGVMPRIQAVTLSAANIRSTATFIANNLTGTKIAGTGLCGDAAYIKSSLTATTLSAKNIHAANLSGILESQVKTDLNQQGGSSSFGHVTIEGDLRVHGTTVSTSASNLSIRDPIIEVAKDQTAPGVDFGLLGNRGSANNSAVIYDESADEWAFIYTTDDATTSGNITITSYTDFQAKDVTFNSATITQGGNITNLNATNLATGSVPDARVPASNVTQHEAALTILKSQVTDFNYFARTAVSGSDMFRLNALTVSATNIRSTGGAIFNTLTAATLQTSAIDTLGNLSATNIHADNSISGTTLSAKNVSAEVMVDTANVFASDSVYIGGRTSTNQLDNYIEGTFTPTISLGSGSVGYATQDGYYTRIGNLVYCTVKIVLNAAASPAGAVTLASFPVASANHTGGAGVGALAASNLSFETNRTELPSNANLSVKMVPNGTTAKIIYTDSEVAMLEATGDAINSDTTLQFSVFYQAS